MGYAVIFNDFSLSGQFSGIDTFLEYIRDNLKSVFNMMEDNEIELMKGHQSFDRYVTEEKTLADIMRQGGNPIISIFMNILIKLAYTEPYWSNNLKTDLNAEYQYPDKNAEPNCITEAIERDIPLLSFRNINSVFEKRYTYKKNGKSGELCNITCTEAFLEVLLKFNRKFLGYVIGHYPYSDNFNSQSVKINSDEAVLFEEDNITDEDIYKIAMNINNMIADKCRGLKSHWWDDLGDGLNEYRISISDGRELRWFFVWGSTIQFLNAFIKKSQETPKREIAKARKMIKELSK